MPDWAGTEPRWYCFVTFGWLMVTSSVLVVVVEAWMSWRSTRGVADRPGAAHRGRAGHVWAVQPAGTRREAHPGALGEAAPAQRARRPRGHHRPRPAPRRGPHPDRLAAPR